MTEQNPKVDGRTKRALDMAIARKQVSQESYRAVIRGELSLQEAKELGRDRRPDDTGRASHGPGRASERPREGRTPRPCLCSCGGITKGGRFLPGHDARLHGELKRQLRSDPLLRSDKFTDEQRRYAVERGLVGPEVVPEVHDG
jgi:hypothetical protein